LRDRAVIMLLFEQLVREEQVEAAWRRSRSVAGS
jgi:hypothetical protein